MKIRGFEIVSAYDGKGITIPSRGTESSAGYDIATAEEVVVMPLEIKLIPTGIKAYMLEDEYLNLLLRSSAPRKLGLAIIPNAIGVIDSDYYNNPSNEGHIFIQLLNIGTEKITLPKGTVLAQGIFQKYLITDEDVPQSSQRVGGFGSTDKK